MNLVDICLVIVVAAVLSGAVYIMVSNRRKGKGCGCGCAGCTKESCPAHEIRREDSRTPTAFLPRRARREAPSSERGSDPQI